MVRRFYALAALFTLLWGAGSSYSTIGGAFVHILLAPAFGVLTLFLFP
jgi:hypothetical protein